MKAPIALLAALALLSGCKTVGPDYERPETKTPETWQGAFPTATNQATAVELDRWWDHLGDETLTGLIKDLADENLDLKTASARVQEALALRGVARAGRSPSLGASAGVASTQLSDAGGGRGLDQPFELYNLGASASWELDWWGRISRSIEAADASILASVEDYRNSLVSLQGQLASSYLTIRELQLRIQLAEENIARQEASRSLTEGRFDAGLAPALDVNQAQLNLSRTEASLPAFHRQLAEQIHRISILTGRTPGALSALLGETQALPQLEPAFPSTLPADLVRRRPDIRAAEQRLIAQTARIGVATAELYPRLSLLGSFSFEATEAGDLFESASQAFRIGPSLKWSLFQGGSIRANIAATEARAEQAVFQYRQTVLKALEEVENALVAYQTETERIAKLRESVEAAEKTVSQVRSLYENGLVNFLNVLDAERSLTSQQDSYAASLGTQGRNLVRIYRALGGGWSPGQPAH